MRPPPRSSHGASESSRGRWNPGAGSREETGITRCGGSELPRREWIDSLTPEHPVLVSRLDGHVALANSLALEMAGVTGSTGVPFGGEMVVDPATREPTGILKDEAMGLVGRVIPASTADELDRALDGANPGGWVPEERISLAEALGAYTMGAALAGFAEGKTGSLEVGKYADMVVLSQDLFETDPLEIPAVRVEMTLVGGEIVFRSEG